MWRFLRNRRLILRLHTMFRALIYWVHRTVILAIAWQLVFQMFLAYFCHWLPILLLYATDEYFSRCCDV